MLLTEPPWYQLNLWVLKVRDSEMSHLVDGLVDGIGQLRSSQEKDEEEREVKEVAEGVHQENSMRGRHELITRNSESQRASASAESEGEKPQDLRGKEGESGEVDISRGNAEREIAREREAETVGRHTAPADGEERDAWLHASARQHQQVDLELLD